MLIKGTTEVVPFIFLVKRKFPGGNSRVGPGRPRLENCNN